LAKQQQTFEQAVSSFKTLEGDVSLLVMEGKKQRSGIRADEPMAVGSAFKLAVLKVLKNQIAEGKVTWGQVVSLQSKQQSFPTGILQDWSAGSLLTVQTLASLMISLSDNTATDTLIDLVGKKEIERIALRNRPFLKTREVFTLRGSKNTELLKKYRLANTSVRAKILEAISQQELPDISDFVNNPKIALDIEWIFTVRELSSLIEDVADLPLMSYNPGIADPKSWAKVAFKGGSDAGVLNFTTLLQSKSGQSYCVSTTWNHNSPVSETKLANLYKSLIDTLPQK
jgi:beta-lactamase class A